MTVLGSLFERRSIENPSRPLTDASLVESLGAWPTDSGVSVSPETALRMTAVYRAVALLAGLMGALPLHAYRRRPGNARERVSIDLVASPHPDKTPFEVFEYFGMSLLCHGNAFALKQRDGLGVVRELEPLHPAHCRVERRGEWATSENPTGKRFWIRDGAIQRRYGPLEVLHIPGLSYDGVVGLSPIGLARQNIGLALAAERYGAQMFSRGALIQGVLETTEEVTQEGADRLRAQWRSKTTGPDRHWDIPVLDSGAKFHAIGLPPEDVQFMETRRFAVADIARLYGLPPHLVGDVERSTSWGTGIEQQNMQMLTFTADPWLVRIEQRLSAEVVLASDTYVKFNRAALLRADTTARFLAYQRAISYGWMSADEIRALEDLDPLPNGTGAVFYRPTNVEPVKAG